MARILAKIIFIVIFISNLAIADDKKVIGLTTLEWPPYEGEGLKDKGAHVVVIRAALAAVGYELNLGIFPWKRAIDYASNSKEYIGYFTEYHSDEIEANFYFSDPIGSAPIGFVERKDNPIKWNSFDDLAKYEIGVTDGYVNTAELDKRIASGVIKTQVVSDDLYDIKKVFSGHIVAAVIDPNVLNYYISTDPKLNGANKVIQFNPKILDEKKHYICFRKTPEGLKMMQIFNEGLKKINAKELISNYFKEMGYTY